MLYMYKTDGHLIIYDKISTNFNKWKSLKSAVQITNGNDGSMLVALISMQMIMKAMYISTLQYMNSSVVGNGKNKYILSYVIGGKHYKMNVKPTRGPTRILQISDENLNDVTDDIVPFMGPTYNWYHEDVTPSTFNHKSLTFETSLGEELTFEENDVLPCM
jgi:archaellum component FlaF (FlaF/FlaG flagellin family)